MKATAKYYKSHPAAKAKKKKYDTSYESTPERLRYRRELARANTKAGSKVGDGKDMSHTKKGGLVKESQSRNRARNGSAGKSTKK